MKNPVTVGITGFDVAEDMGLEPVTTDVCCYQLLCVVAPFSLKFQGLQAVNVEMTE